MQRLSCLWLWSVFGLVGIGGVVAFGGSGGVVSAAPIPASRPASGGAASKESDPSEAFKQKVTEFRLSNGMLFLLIRRPNVPTFAAYIRVRAGGVDEPTGYTGLAHIFEHMAFKGTTIVGSQDWLREKEVLEKINTIGEALAAEMIRSQGRKTPLAKTLQGLLGRLQAQHKLVTRRDEFTRIYQGAGATGINATTDKDLTSYFVSLPSNRLELWAYQEASRLAAPVFREFYRERSVVVEERRMSMSEGEGRLYEAFLATAFLAHPYRTPTVGWMSDISTIPLAALQDFFLRYYTPSNMVGCLVGDLDIAHTKAVLEKTFGLLPPGPPPPPIRTREPRQDGERRVEIRFHTRPHVMIGFHKPTAPHPDDYVFDVIEHLLTKGRTSRLYKALVLTKKAQKIWASSLPGARYPNLFTLSAAPIAPFTADAVVDILQAEIDRLKTQSVPPRELQTVRHSMAMDFLRNLRSNQGLAAQISYTQAAIGDWRYLADHSKRIEAITSADIQRVAQRYFRKEARTVGIAVQTQPQAPRLPPSPSPKPPPTAKPVASAKPTPVPPPTPRPLAAKPFATSVPASSAAAKPVLQPESPTSKPVASAKPTPVPPPTLRPLAAKPEDSARLKAKMQARKAALQRLVESILKGPGVPALVRELPPGLQKHPADLPTQPLRFTPPKVEIVRLPNGLWLYLLPEKELPLVDIYGILDTGRLYDPADKIGLAELVGRTLRSGGFGGQTPDAIDDEIAFRAATLESQIDSDHGTIQLSVHRRDLSWGLSHLALMLQKPDFQDQRIAVAKAQMLESWQRRNDEPFRLAITEFRKLVFGAEHRLSKLPSPQTIKAIRRADLQAFHRDHIHPKALRLAIVGDFEKTALLAQIQASLGAWNAQGKPTPPVAPLPSKTKPRIALLRRPLPQSLILVGHLGLRRHDPDAMAGMIMNHILGGGDFASRLMSEIRTNQGLAYFAGSQLSEAKDRGTFLAYTGTRPEQTGKALRLLLDLLRQMHRQGKVTPDELELARKTFLNRFVFLFNSPSQIVYRQALFDLLGYPKDHLTTYRDRLQAISHADITRAAKRFLDPSQFAILVIGPAERFDIPLSTFGTVEEIDIE